MSNETHFNEIELFQQLARGDEKAFRDIFLYYYPRLVSFAAKITKNEDDAEEIAQEALLRLWKRREEFHHTNYLGSWLYKVASNLAFDFLKRASRENKLLIYFKQTADPYRDIIPELENKEREAEILAAIKQLPPQQALIYKLSREEGLSHQQIAEKLNISTNTVKNHLVKVLQTLRKVLNKTANLFFSIFF